MFESDRKVRDADLISQLKETLKNEARKESSIESSTAKEIADLKEGLNRLAASMSGF